MTTKNPGFTVVQDMKTAGAIIWWRLTGDTNAEALREAWEKAGLDKKLLPDNPSPTLAMGRACDKQASKRRLIRPLPGGKGWAIVDEAADNTTGELTYETKAAVKLSGGQLVIDATGLETTAVNQLRKDYESLQTYLTVNDVSTWLSKLMKPELKAVTLRDTGGVYFIPRDYVDTYRQMVSAIGEASEHQLFEVPALKTDEAVEAILDAVLREADQECTAMETELDTGDLKKRALKARAGKCDDLRVKVEAYEKLLGKSLPKVQQRIEDLKASVVAAELTVQGSEAAA